VDIIKPNVTELVQMVHHCLGVGLINNGRALVQNTLSTIAGNRIDQGSLQQSLDISDVRVLLNALYQVMHGPSGANMPQAVPQKQSFLGGLLGHDKASAKSAAALNPTASGSPVTGGGAAGAGRAVSGKHIIVSMGGRGLVWCGPAKHLTASPASAPGSGSGPATSPAYLKDGSCVVNEATQSATLHIPALTVNPADIVHTNGAGDALCAGLLAEIVRKAAAADDCTASAQAPLLPDMECIHKGLLSAHHWLVSK
jgi:hypothetical protein